MDCQENKSGCDGCNPSVIKVGKWWWQIRYVPRKGNEEFIDKMNSITKEKAEQMGQEGLDKYFTNIKPPTVETVDFIDQIPDPQHTHDGKMIYWKCGKKYEISDFISAEKIQVALCRDPLCRDPECQKYQAEIREKEKNGILRIVK